MIARTILNTAPSGSATNKNISVFFIGGKDIPYIVECQEKNQYIVEKR
jgi:hypothetical protein